MTVLTGHCDPCVRSVAGVQEDLVNPWSTMDKCMIELVAWAPIVVRLCSV